MNEGYTAIWLLSIGLILYWTGWQRQVAGRITGSSILIYLLGASLLHPVNIPIGFDIALRGSAVWAFAAGFVGVAAVRNAMQTVFVILCAMLAGSVWLWIRYMYVSDPVFILVNPGWDGPLVAGLLAGLLTDRFRYHYAIVIFAATIAVFSGIVVRHTSIMIGNPAWWDGAAIGLVVARIAWNVKVGLRYLGGRIAEGHWRRQRGGSS
ncbi:YphA family membrane protein [Paenibacillus mendelii]|uniref:Integral membrane protein n=1 Tax=Paenibacillus mendelii TaxID=206163 RepID=A0ABV6JGX6_9BACL|nr:hypothetical protein [Paenibacillus mendelii]MCQ6558053.1 hypothetical protein [Paenibacillus mendelii]